MILKKTLTLFLIAIELLIFNPLVGQIQNVRFNHIDVEEGLPENTIHAILQDSKGFLWFATWNGLCRYDGYEVKVYKHINGDSSSLIANKITCLLEDQNQRLWIGTFGGGLSLYNRDNETFTNFVHDPNNKYSILSNEILSLFEDSNKRIWIGVNKSGVSLIDENISTNSRQGSRIGFINFENDTEGKNGFSRNRVVSMLEDRTGTVWFGAFDGSVIQLADGGSSPESYRFIAFQRPADHTPGSRLNVMIEDRFDKGLLWLISHNSSAVWFDTRSEKFIEDNPQKDHSGEIPINNLRSMFITEKGEYWFGTNGDGVYTYQPDEKNKNPETEHYSIINDENMNDTEITNIRTIYEDASGLVWLGTDRNGVYFYQKRSKEFNSYTLSKNSFREGEKVLHVYEDKDDNLWICTNAGLNKYDPVTQEYISFKHNPSDNGSINSNVVYTAIHDSGGTLWLGTDKGLDKYNPSTNTFTHYFHDEKDTNSIGQGLIINSFVDSKGTLWLGGWGGGLNKPVFSSDGKIEKFLHYRKDPNDPNSISDNSIMSFAETKEGTLWIGTAYGGLNKLVSDYEMNEKGVFSKPRFISYQTKPGDPHSISGNDVRSICIDQNATFWIGTYGGGMNKFIPPADENEQAIFYHYRHADGLANDVVKCIFSDKKGRLWISTSYGLSMFNPDENLFSNFYISDGLQLDKFGGVYHKSNKTGRLYFGGDEGLISFIPENIKINEYKPKIAIISLRTYNEKDNRMTEVNGMPYRKKITLSYHDNILNFEFAALNFYNSSQNKYAYKLQGYNKNWIQLGTKRDVTFTNLDPGKYKLLVRGSNNDGIWNESGTALDIIITPPWWLTNWAYGVYLSLLIVGIFITHKIMRRRVIKIEKDKAYQREAELIKKQAGELQTIDGLVRVINQAENLEDLFNSLLQQTMNIIPNAEKAAVFLRDKKDGLFRVAFTAGYKVKELERVSFTYTELKNRYAKKSEEAEKGIYIIRNTENLPGDEKLSAFSKAKSMLVMAVEQEKITEAFVVFDSFSSEYAFDKSAASLLTRFSEHAVSAISKAQAIKSLQEKNEEIVKTQKQLVHSEKLASLGELTAGIAHEIQNPLNFVNNFSEVNTELIEELKEELEEGNLEEVKAIANDLAENEQKINLHGKRADGIVKGMLHHSRTATGQKEPTNINILADEYLRLAYHGLRAKDKSFNADFRLEADKSIPKVIVIPQDIGRVLLNLINNAFFAVREKSNENIDRYKPEVVIRTKRKEDQVEITVKDNGNGIPDEVKNKIFQPFFTTKPAGEGTGLGLSLSYDIIVKGHGGSLDMETKAGEGSKFLITLPINSN